MTSLLCYGERGLILKGLKFLETHRHSLVKLQIFFHAVGRAAVFGVQDPSRGEIVYTAVEAEFAELVV